jgi:hypothetical protein
MQDERRAANYAAPLAAVVIKIPNIVLGKLPLNAMVTTYLGPIDFLKEEGLSVEIMRSQVGPAINQAMCRYCRRTRTRDDQHSLGPRRDGSKRFRRGTSQGLQEAAREIAAGMDNER